MFYLIDYYHGYHLSVTGGLWSQQADAVSLNGMSVVVFTDAVTDEAPRLEPVAATVTLPAVFVGELNELTTWGASYIPEDWAVGEWSDVGRRLAQMMAFAGTGVRKTDDE